MPLLRNCSQKSRSVYDDVLAARDTSRSTRPPGSNVAPTCAPAARELRRRFWRAQTGAGDNRVVRQHWLEVPVACVLAVSAAGAQSCGPSVRDLVKAARPLTPGEDARVLSASRIAIAGKRGRLTSAADDAAGRPGTEFAISSNGRLQFLRSSGGIQGGLVVADGTSTTWTREVITITHLTGLPAQGCDGTPRAGQLVVQYRNEGDGWFAIARTRVYAASPTPLDDFLAGDLRVDSGELQMIGARSARVFVAPWTTPTNTAQASANTVQGPEYRSDDGGRTWTKTSSANTPRLTQSLWVDTESLLPVRWAVMSVADPEHGVPAKPYNVLSIRYDDASDIQPPPGATPPDCVP